MERHEVDVINAVISSKVRYSKGEEMIDMCIAIQEIKEEGRLEGEIIGIIRSNKRHRIPQEDTRRFLIEEYKKTRKRQMN